MNYHGYQPQRPRMNNYSIEPTMDVHEPRDSLHKDAQQGLWSQLNNDDGYFESFLLGCGICLVLLLACFMVFIHLPEEEIPEKPQLVKITERAGEMEVENAKMESKSISNLNSVIRDLHYKIKKTHDKVDTLADTDERLDIAKDLKSMNTQLSEIASTVSSAKVIEPEVSKEAPIKEPEMTGYAKGHLVAASAITAGLAATGAGMYKLVDDFGAIERKGQMETELGFYQKFDATNQAAMANGTLEVEFTGTDNAEKAEMIKNIMAEMAEKNVQTDVDTYMSTRGMSDTLGAQWDTHQASIKAVNSQTTVPTTTGGNTSPVTILEEQPLNFNGQAVQIQDLADPSQTRTLYAVSYQNVPSFGYHTMQEVTVNENGELVANFPADSNWQGAVKVTTEQIGDMLSFFEEDGDNGYLLKFFPSDVDPATFDLGNEDEFIRLTNQTVIKNLSNMDGNIMITTTQSNQGSVQAEPETYRMVATNGETGELMPLNMGEDSIIISEPVQNVTTGLTAVTGDATVDVLQGDTGVVGDFEFEHLSDNTLIDMPESIQVEFTDAEALLEHVSDIADEMLMIAIPFFIVGALLIASASCWCWRNRLGAVADLESPEK